VHALAGASSIARMKAVVEPLPLVPATWITGGSRRSGWPSVGHQPLDAVERQVDLARMQPEQALQDGA
jgi:hypothetical protein